MLPNVLLTTAELPDAPDRAAGKKPEKKPAADLFGALLALWSPLAGTAGRPAVAGAARGLELPEGGKALPPMPGTLPPTAASGNAVPPAATGPAAALAALTGPASELSGAAPAERPGALSPSGTPTGSGLPSVPAAQPGTPTGYDLPSVPAAAPAKGGPAAAPAKGGPAAIAPATPPLAPDPGSPVPEAAAAQTGAAVAAGTESAAALRMAAGIGTASGPETARALPGEGGQAAAGPAAPSVRDVSPGAARPVAPTAHPAPDRLAASASESLPVRSAAEAARQNTPEEGARAALAVSAATGAAAPAALAGVPPAAAPSPAAASGTPGATPPAVPVLPPIDVPPGSAGWDDALGGRVSVMARHDLQHAEIHLHPAELGPLRVQVSVDDGKASLHFHAQHPLTRDAIEQALPRLRDMLGEHGIALGEASVSGQGSAHSQAQPERDPSGGRGAGIVRAIETAASAGLPPATLRRGPPGRVDLFA